jgi:methylthioribose-1-phosphate isomerase
MDKLEGIEGLQGISSAASSSEFLRAAFQTAPADYWTDILQEAGIATAQPNAIEDLRE